MSVSTNIFLGSRNVKDHSSEDEQNEVQDESGLSRGDDDEPKLPVDMVCAGEADGPCTLGSGDHRKVVSHVFGRNKRCTHQIPDDCWIKYCRKHYQRQKYRCPSDWFETQLLLIDGQIDKMEAWGGITSWTIAIRKKERELLDQENNYKALHDHLPEGPRCRERFLLKYLGTNKTFADIRNLINVINQNCDETQNFTLPSFELLPVIDERRNPRPRRSGAARRLMKNGTTSTTSTFRLSTTPSGQLLKTEASPSRIPSAASSSVTRHHGSSVPKARNEPARVLKRLASAFDGDKDKADTNHKRPMHRRHQHTEVDKHSVPVLASPVEDKNSNELGMQSEFRCAFRDKRHVRSISI